ncbi:MAG: type II secretion system F family protein [Pirellulales bacterium]
MTPFDPTHSTPLSAADGSELASELAYAFGHAAPVDATLRAAASDTGGRVGRALERIASRVEQGEPLEAALAVWGGSLPAPLRTILAISARQGNLQQTLNQWDFEQQRMELVRRELRGAIGYPFFVLFASCLVIALVTMITGGIVQEVVREFQIKVDWYIASMLWLNQVSPYLIGVFVVGFFLTIATRLFIGRALWHSLLSSLPIVGPIWTWLAMAQWSRWLALLIDADVALPEALELAAGATDDAYVAHDARVVRKRVEQGESLSRAMADAASFPASATVLIRWGEQSQGLATCLRSAAELCEERASLRSRWLRLVLPPFAYAMTATSTVCAYALLLSPLFVLIKALI